MELEVGHNIQIGEYTTYQEGLRDRPSIHALSLNVEMCAGERKNAVGHFADGHVRTPPEIILAYFCQL